jgi:hypothetical protein
MVVIGECRAHDERKRTPVLKIHFFMYYVAVGKVYWDEDASVRAYTRFICRQEGGACIRGD